MLQLVSYLLVGAAVFFGLRFVFKKLGIDSRPHYNIWTFGIRGSELLMPEAWLCWGITILFWPLFAALSLCWLAAELFHLSGKRELERCEALERKRDKTYDHLTLDQKLALLEAEARKQK